MKADRQVGRQTGKQATVTCNAYDSTTIPSNACYYSAFILGDFQGPCLPHPLQPWISVPRPTPQKSWPAIKLLL